MLDAFRRNTSMEYATKKLDIILELVSKIFDSESIRNAMPASVRTQICKLYAFQILMHSKDPAIYAAIMLALKLAGYLWVPFNISLFRNTFGDFHDYAKVLRKSVSIAKDVYMRSMVLKFDDPLKTGCDCCYLHAINLF